MKLLSVMGGKPSKESDECGLLARLPALDSGTFPLLCELLRGEAADQLEQELQSLIQRVAPPRKARASRIQRSLFARLKLEAAASSEVGFVLR